MTLQQLKYIIEIVNCGSINEAAKRLYITQPSLSSAVKELEAEIGIELFIRTTKGISLTVDGAEFLSYARQVVEQAGLLEQRYLNKSLPVSFAPSPHSIMPLPSMHLSTSLGKAVRMNMNLLCGKHEHMK
ncbi:hypothetical protein N752_17130 [Desulforamulus aquiferis]|nr:hypothetical protein N752_17130 [Desulforamulus aquiferis]